MYIYKILQNNLINNILFTMFFGVQNNLIKNVFLPCSMKYKIIKSARYFYHTPWSTKNNSITIIYFLPYSLKKNNFRLTIYFSPCSLMYKIFHITIHVYFLPCSLKNIYTKCLPIKSLLLLKCLYHLISMYIVLR